MHCTIHHELASVAPREIFCFTGRSEHALQLSSLVLDGAATDCLPDASVSAITRVAEETVILHVGPPSAYAHPSAQ